ncbi:hypothetical protein AAXE64_08490 [Priestia megaterium]
MYKFPYKERDYAETILKNGFTSNYINHELKLLVKYYKELGKKPKERKELLHEFCEKRLLKYSRVTHFKMINSVLAHGTKKENVLVQIDKIDVTKNEFNFINNFEIDHTYKKVLFTLLVLDKLSKQHSVIRNGESSEEHYFGGGAKYRELSSTSHVKFKKNQNIHSLIGELANHGLVEIKNKGFIKLSFIYSIEETDEIELSVNDFQRIGLYFDLHTGQEKIKKCECCKVPIKIKGKYAKYCEECWNEKEKERKRRVWHENKHKYKN